MIKGLLLQPGIVEAWDVEMATHHGFEQPERVWQASTIGDLQARLEMGPSNEQSPQSLAKAAYEASWGASSVQSPYQHQLLPAQSSSLHGVASMSMPWEAQSSFFNTESDDNVALETLTAPQLQRVLTPALDSGFNVDPSELNNEYSGPGFDWPLDAMLFSQDEYNEFEDIL